MRQKRGEVIQALTQQYLCANNMLNRDSAKQLIEDLYDNRQSEDKLEIIFEVLFAECDDNEDNALDGDEITQFVS